MLLATRGIPIGQQQRRMLQKGQEKQHSRAITRRRLLILLEVVQLVQEPRRSLDHPLHVLDGAVDEAQA